MPWERDTMLVSGVECRNADKEYNKIKQSEKVIDFLKEQEFLYNISKIANHTLNDLSEFGTFWEVLDIESQDFEYWWTHVWTKE